MFRLCGACCTGSGGFACYENLFLFFSEPYLSRDGWLVKSNWSPQLRPDAWLMTGTSRCLLFAFSSHCSWHLHRGKNQLVFCGSGLWIGFQMYTMWRKKFGFLFDSALNCSCRPSGSGSVSGYVLYSAARTGPGPDLLRGARTVVPSVVAYNSCRCCTRFSIIFVFRIM
jgi:hypothetical protein